jgi:hypothetical protein
MIQARTERQTNLADHLSPHVQRIASVLPLRDRQRRPGIGLPDDAGALCRGVHVDSFRREFRLPQDDLIDVAPAPVFSRLKGLDDRVVALMKVFSGMLVF